MIHLSEQIKFAKSDKIVFSKYPEELRKEYDLKETPSIYSSLEIAKSALNHYVKPHNYTMMTDDKVYAIVVNRDISKMKKAGFSVIFLHRL